MELVDKIIGVFSPRAMYRRTRYRQATAMLNDLARKYEGATKGRRGEGWNATSASVNSENRAGLVTLRNRARDLVRNNPYAKRGIRIIGNDVIGKGIHPIIKAKNAEQKRELDELWKQWAGKPHQVDYDGKMNFTKYQRTTVESTVESGEVLVRRRRVTMKNGQVLPIQLQMLESDHIATNLTIPGMKNGNRIAQGVEFDAKGKVVAYHLYEDHPGNYDAVNLTTRFKTVRVPAEDLCHVYEILRPGQLRGITWLTDVMLRLKDFDDYQDAHRVRQKIAACFAAFVHDLEAPDTLTAGTAEAGEIGEKVEPGIIEVLPPGKDVKFATPPGVEGYKEYSSVELHAIATGIGVTYEDLTGDFNEVNFSSARMGRLRFHSNVDRVQNDIVNPRLNDPVFEWFLEAAMLAGYDTEGVTWEWSVPRRPMVDPTKEVPAKVKSVRAGFETLSDVIRQNGKHPEEHLEEIKKDNELLDQLKLTLDSDARNLNQHGDSNEPQSSAE